jgi:hypothetical protein
MRRVTSKSAIARDFFLVKMHVWRPGFARTRWKSLSSPPDFIFRSQMHQKRLAAGLRPDPLGSLSAPPCPLSAVGAMEGNNSPVQLGAHCGEEEGGGSVEGLLLNLSSREISSSSQNACLAAGRRPAPLGELERSPRHTSRSGCHGRGHSPAAVRVLCGEDGRGVEVRGRGGDE